MNRETKSHISSRPDWLRKRITPNPVYSETCSVIERQGLHTVCQAAQCPNHWECFSQKTATFLILGEKCSRDCRFCGVLPGSLDPPDQSEPDRVASAAQAMQLKYVVITSVTRDDLPDGGAELFAKTIAAIRDRISGVRIEVLIPDFQGDPHALATVVDAGPDVLNHNIETVPRLYKEARPQADYRRSLELLRRAGERNPAMPTKSGMMLGLGETDKEIETTLADLLNARCRILTLGQYLQPTKDHLPVKRYIRPLKFSFWHDRAKEMGFSEVASGPFVRSSYQANEIFDAAKRASSCRVP